MILGCLTINYESFLYFFNCLWSNTLYLNMQRHACIILMKLEMRNETFFFLLMSSVQFSSVVRSCPTLCDPMDYSTPVFPVHHQHLELTQTHVHRVGDAIQPSHPLSSPSLPTFNLSQHEDVFQWVSSSHQVAKVLEFRFCISPSN